MNGTAKSRMRPVWVMLAAWGMCLTALSWDERIMPTETIPEGSEDGSVNADERWRAGRTPEGSARKLAEAYGRPEQVVNYARPIAPTIYKFKVQPFSLPPDADEATVRACINRLDAERKAATGLFKGELEYYDAQRKMNQDEVVRLERELDSAERREVERMENFLDLHAYAGSSMALTSTESERHQHMQELWEASGGHQGDMPSADRFVYDQVDEMGGRPWDVGEFLTDVRDHVGGSDEPSMLVPRYDDRGVARVDDLRRRLVSLKETAAYLEDQYAQNRENLANLHDACRVEEDRLLGVLRATPGEGSDDEVADLPPGEETDHIFFMLDRPPPAEPEVAAPSKEDALREAEESVPAEAGAGQTPEASAWGGAAVNAVGATWIESVVEARERDAADPAGWDSTLAERAGEAESARARAEAETAAAAADAAAAIRQLVAVSESARREEQWRRENSWGTWAQSLLLGTAKAAAEGLGGGLGERLGSDIMERVIQKEFDSDDNKEIQPPPPPAATGGGKPGPGGKPTAAKPPPIKKPPQPGAIKPAPGSPVKKPPAPGAAPAPAAPAPAINSWNYSGPRINRVLMTGNQTRDPYPGEATHPDPQSPYLLPGP